MDAKVIAENITLALDERIIKHGSIQMEPVQGSGIPMLRELQQEFARRIAESGATL